MNVKTVISLGLVKLVGLSERALRAYLALVENGPSNARELARYLGVPYTKVYGMLRELEKHGLVHVDRTRRPEVFYARPPAELYAKVLTGVSSALSSLKTSLDLLQAQYEASHKLVAEDRERALVSILKGFESVKNDAVKTVVSSSSCVDIAMPYEDFLREASLLSSIIEESKSKRVRLLIPPDLKLDPIPPRVEVRRKEGMFGGGVLGDGVLLVVRYRGDYFGVRFNEPYLIDIARTYFNKLWEESL